MIDLSLEYKKTNIPKEKFSYKGLDAFVNTFYGMVYKRLLMPSQFKKRAKKISKLSLTYSSLSDEQLNNNLLEYRKQFRLNKSELVMNEAIACIVELTYRVFNIRPYSVQIMGILAQQKNLAIEMLPGEGKTITASISAILKAWNGKPCHIATSNDYLASRDAKEMKILYNRCYLNVGYVISSFNDNQRRQNYKNDIVYATSKELLADFLRDYIKDTNNSFDENLINNIKSPNSIKEDKVMRGLYTAIIDEADSVLADDALTPLIISISVKNEDLHSATLVAKDICDKLILNEDYTLDFKYKDVTFLDLGIEKIKDYKQSFPEIWRSKYRREFLLQQAISAKEFFLINKEYLIDEENKIVIVDEKTGRMMEGRTWSAGLHQAIEAKEGLELSDPTKTEVKMSFQRFFRLYKNLSGMSGTLQKLQKEFWQIYKLPTIKIPKRIKNTYVFKKEIICSNQKDKWNEVFNEILNVHESKRPILVGTKNIHESQRLALMLDTRNINYTVLNAKQEKEEAKIVLDAGKISSITIATNIAGRGTDIKIDKEIEDLGGLHVISTQKFSSIRVDLQLYGRTARQGQKGSVQAIYSLDDDLLNNFSIKWILDLLKNNVNNKIGYFLSKVLYIYIQQKIEKQSSSLRNKNLINDFDLMQRLPFSSLK